MTQSLRFEQEDLAEFAQASRDVNPLHSDAAYARATSFGEPVVFGALATLAVLGRLAPRPAGSLATLSAEFASPLVTGVSYSLEIDDDGRKASVRVRDGSRMVLRMAAEFSDGQVVATDEFYAEHGRDEPAAPAMFRTEDLAPGMVMKGQYAPRAAEFIALYDRLGLARCGVAPSQAAALLGCSYVVGMRIPGRDALFYSLALDWTKSQLVDEGAFTAEITSLHRPLGLITIDVKFAAPLAVHGVLKSFVRQPIMRAVVPAADIVPGSMVGKVAIVIGASRGLGSAIAEALCRSGCVVVGTYLHGHDAATETARRFDSIGAVFEPRRCDATDQASVAKLVADVTNRYGGVDLLVCTACPPLRSLGIDEASLGRLLGHVSESLAMVATPLACVLDGLQKREGAVLLLSSAAVAAPPGEWPHYVAAKSAIEGLAAVTARARKAVHVWVARPPKLLTELVNTPLGRQGAADPGVYAAALVRAIVLNKEDPTLGLRLVVPGGSEPL